MWSPSSSDRGDGRAAKARRMSPTVGAVAVAVAFAVDAAAEHDVSGDGVSNGDEGGDDVACVGGDSTDRGNSGRPRSRAGISQLEACVPVVPAMPVVPVVPALAFAPADETYDKWAKELSWRLETTSRCTRSRAKAAACAMRLDQRAHKRRTGRCSLHTEATQTNNCCWWHPP